MLATTLALALLATGAVAGPAAPAAAADAAATADATAATASNGAPLTLEQALDLAHRANARLPVAALEPRLAEQRLRAARAQRRVVLSADGELWLAPAGGYDTTVTDRGDERLQIVAERTLFDGGGARARERQAQAGVGAARAHYRQQVADVDLRVRDAFAGLLAARREVATRGAALDRLRHYLALLDTRAAAGQPLTADRLSTRVRLAADTAAWVDAQGRAEQARAELDAALGLPLDADPALVPLPPPVPPGPSAAETGDGVPATAAAFGARPATGSETDPATGFAEPATGLAEIAAARREAEAATAGLAAARAERSPQVTLRADAGLWGADPFHAAGLGDRFQRDLGTSLSLGVHLPLFGTGGVDARVAEAELALEQARRGVTQARVEARLELEQARQAQAAAYRRYRVLADAQPVVRDARLDAESRYWGGAATSREVLDAFSSAVDAAVALDDAELAYHQATARRRRWAGADAATPTEDLP